MGTKLLLRILAAVVGAVVVVAAALWILVRFEILEDPLRSIAEDLGIVSAERVSTSSLLLEELRDIYMLNTVEYIYRTVFPFDYMPESTSMPEIMDAIREGSGPIDEILTAEEQLFFDAANLAEEVGLGGEEFIVLTVRVYAGFDLEGTPYGAGTAAAGRWVTVQQDPENGRRTAHVRPPKAAVTDIVIEDVDPDTYRYPDVGMDAESWREIAAFVSEHVENRTVEEGILETARANARELVRNLLLSAGLDQVSFANEANRSANSDERR